MHCNNNILYKSQLLPTNLNDTTKMADPENCHFDKDSQTYLTCKLRYSQHSSQLTSMFLGWKQFSLIVRRPPSSLVQIASNHLRLMLCFISAEFPSHYWMTPRKWLTPKTATLIETLRLISHANCITANTAVNWHQCFCGETVKAVFPYC